MKEPEVAFYIYAIAYAYALFLGQLIGLVTNYMYKTVDPEEKGKYPHTWQAPIIGIVERTLYLSSLLAGHASFIGLWVGLKLGFQYKRWTEDEGNQVGRTLFMNNLIGNGLSILFAGVGYGMIGWAKSNKMTCTIGVPIILAFGTVLIRLWLGLYMRRKAKTGASQTLEDHRNQSSNS